MQWRNLRGKAFRFGIFRAKCLAVRGRFALVRMRKISFLSDGAAAIAAGHWAGQIWQANAYYDTSPACVRWWSRPFCAEDHRLSRAIALGCGILAFRSNHLPV